MSTLGTMLLWNVALATLLALFVSLLSRLAMFKRRPALAHTLWLLVLAKLVTPPLIPLPVLPSTGGSGKPTPASAVSSEGSSAELSFVAVSPRSVEDLPEARRESGWPWFVLLAGASALGTLVLVVACLVQIGRISRLLRYANSDDERLERLARAAAVQMSARQSPAVCVVDAPLVPFLWVAWSGPVVILPRELALRMSDEQLSCILCHELAHHARRDHWANAFAFLVAALFWWHPVAWWARREMRAAQEICCDGLALAAGAATRHAYAQTLFQALELVQCNRPLWPSVASGFGSRCALKRRFEMIANQHVTERRSWWVAAWLVAGAVSLLCVPTRRATSGEPLLPPDKAQSRPDHDPLHKVKVVERATMNFDSLEATVDPKKHCIFVTETEKSVRTGALRFDLERGVTYTFQASGEAFMTSQTGVDADPFPGLMLYYPTDEEDCYAWRMAVLRPGDKVTFKTPWLIKPDDEVFALAFFLAITPDEHRGSYKLAIKKTREAPVVLNHSDAIIEFFDREISKSQIQFLRNPARAKP